MDGLGMNIVRRLPADSFLAAYVRAELTSICPSTTACALTSLATAQYPNRTAVTGWFTHVPDLGLTAVMLPFVDRFTGEPLAERGLRAEDLLPAPSIYPRMTAPAALARPDLHLRHALQPLRPRRHARPRVRFDPARDRPDHRADPPPRTGPTFTHLYLPEVDSICHKLGVGHADVVPLVMRIDAELARLRHAALRGATGGPRRASSSAPTTA